MMMQWRHHAVLAFALMSTLPGLAFGQVQIGYDTSPGAQTGQQISGSYFASDTDRIGLYNGNVMLEIPLVPIPGRELSANLTLSYNSQKWEQADCGGMQCG